MNQMFTILAFWEENVFLHCLWLVSQKKMCLSQELALETLSAQQEHKNDEVASIRKYLNSTYILQILEGPWYEILHTPFICIISNLNLSTKGLQALLPVTSAQLFLINHKWYAKVFKEGKLHSTLFLLWFYYCTNQPKLFQFHVFLKQVLGYYPEEEVKIQALWCCLQSFLS